MYWPHAVLNLFKRLHVPRRQVTNHWLILLFYHVVDDLWMLVTELRFWWRCWKINEVGAKFFRVVELSEESRGTRSDRISIMWLTFGVFDLQWIRRRHYVPYSFIRTFSSWISKWKWPNHARTVATVWYAVALEARMRRKRKSRIKCAAI